MCSRIGIHIIPGGSSIYRFDNKHIDISVYAYIYRAGWPFGPPEGLSGIQVPITDRQTLEDSHTPFRLIDPNTLHVQVGVMEAIVEVKTFANSNEVYNKINEAVGQAQGAYQPLGTNIGLVVIPWERWNEASQSQKNNSENVLIPFEEEMVKVPFYPEEQQKGYFKLSKRLRSNAEGAYKYIKRDLENINCTCN